MPEPGSSRAAAARSSPPAQSSADPLPTRVPLPYLVPYLCRLLRAALLPLKRLYGIRMRVWGSEQLQLQGPFVIVCNHQASLDLMGACRMG